MIFSSTLDLTPYNPQFTNVYPGNEKVLKLNNIPSDVSYVICQLHTYTHNLTLSLTHKATPSTSVIGRNVGVVTVLSVNQTEATWYINSTHNTTAKALVNVVLIHKYGMYNADPFKSFDPIF